MPKKKTLKELSKNREENITARLRNLEDFQERAIKYISELEKRIKKLEKHTVNITWSRWPF